MMEAIEQLKARLRRLISAAERARDNGAADIVDGYDESVAKLRAEILAAEAEERDS